MGDADPQKQLASALGRIPSGLFVLTARKDGAETGMLASWVQQCSFQPPQITVAIKSDRYLLAWLGDGAAFTLNILDASQTDMIVHFGRGFGPGDAAFEGLDIERDGAGGPVLSEALAYLKCRVAGSCRAGDHVLLIAQVVAGRLLGDGQPMVHVRKSGCHY